MADKRMFSKKIIDSDAFLDMPITARLLYYDLSMRADDDGFVNAPKKIMRMVGASVDDIGVLVAKKFVIPFESGVVVIKHWLIHNYIRKDTYHETTYKDEKALLSLDENMAYTMEVDNPSTFRQRSVDESSTQVRLGKVRLGKVRLVECSEEDTHTYQSLCEKYGKSFVDERMERAKKYKNIDISKIAIWCEEDSKKKPKELKSDYDIKEIEKILTGGSKS